MTAATFDELISRCSDDHDRDPAGVARALAEGVDLVGDASQAARFVALVNHVTGKELGDWAGAARIGRQALARVASAPPADLTAARVQIATAHYLAGETAAGLGAEADAVAGDPGAAAATLVRVRVLVAEGLAGARRAGEAIALFRAALAAARTLPAPSPADRAVAVVANNLTSALLEDGTRGADATGFLEEGAQAARDFWLRAGNWVNDERSDYLLALVYNALGRPDDALAAARRGLETIARNGDEPVDAAFLHIATAVAERGRGNPDLHQAALAAATALGSRFPADLKGWLDTELEKAR